MRPRVGVQAPPPHPPRFDVALQRGVTASRAVGAFPLGEVGDRRDQLAQRGRVRVADAGAGCVAQAVAPAMERDRERELAEAAPLALETARRQVGVPPHGKAAQDRLAPVALASALAEALVEVALLEARRLVERDPDAAQARAVVARPREVAEQLLQALWLGDAMRLGEEQQRRPGGARPGVVEDDLVRAGLPEQAVPGPQCLLHPGLQRRLGAVGEDDQLEAVAR
jgi:hypothetical protein